MKKITILICGLLFVGLIFQRCRQEANSLDQYRNEIGIQKQITKQELLLKIGEFNNEILNFKSKNGKSDYTFQIDYSKIIELENAEGDTSYSMRILPENPNEKKNDSLAFYNIYFQKKNDEITYFIIKYEPTIETVLSNYKNFQANYSFISGNIEKNKSQKFDDCGIAYLEFPCANGYVHPENGPGDWCDAQGSYTYMVKTCDSSNGGSGGNGSDGTITLPPNNGTGGGGGGNGNNNGNGNTGAGVLINPDGEPAISSCANIKAKQQDSKYTEKFDALNKNSIFSMDKERGFFERQSPPANNLGSHFIQLDGQVGTTGLSLPSNLNGIVGLLHSHNDKDGVIKIFSPTDVRTFINHFMPQANSYLGSYTNAYSTVVTSAGSYTLRFSKPIHPGGINHATFTEWENWYKKEYRLLIDNDNLTQANVERVFTQFLKEKVNIDGLEVYKVTNSTASKIEYNGINQPVKSTPCP